ncbi:helix-turn-helix transcriptional regulator [uncultured Acetobacterium sp.]|uniref:helix-turn-helix transcriptional regulator n=1 Tax=uncultured Acetobacterium sp. TaxID=217139 RepID=UPI0025E9A02F|nr:helix-turn-helix transcriptional regulator [uncultured Acetobacterium sp.]
MLINRKQIGLILMKLRGDRTQREVAIALNISEPAIRYYESGKRIPKDNIKIKIARYYDKKVDEIFFVSLEGFDDAVVDQ